MKNIALNEFKLPIILGKDQNGKIIVKDFVDIENILMSGCSGSGKSVFINSFIYTLLKSEELKSVEFIMIDPKIHNLTIFSKLRNLKFPVISNSQRAFDVLDWCVNEIKDRTEKQIDFNESVKSDLPYIVIIVDEVSDLILSKTDPSDKIYQIAKNGPSVGLHMILSTSSPGKNIFTKELKSVISGRISGYLSNKEDSKTVLDMEGAQELQSSGDMIYRNVNTNELVNVQAPFISSELIEKM